MKTFLKYINIFLFLLGIFLGNVFGKTTCFSPSCHRKADFYKKIVHLPVKENRCLDCHSPHVSKNRALLRKPSSDLCKNCHNSFYKEIKDSAYKIHAPVAQKACLRCHSPHTSNFKFLLKKNLKDLCLECHKNLKKQEKYIHKPFVQGKCLVCHEAHFSKKDYFLKNSTSKICIKCHKNIRKSHPFLKTKKGDCLSCHDPHSSSKKYLLLPVAHNPYGKNKCYVCHKRKMACIKCHTSILNSFSTLHNHLLGTKEDNQCLLCHSPHLGRDKNLLKDKQGHLCLKCHKQVAVQKTQSLYIHPHIDSCTDCHYVHGSNAPEMLKQGGIKTCTSCHKTQGKFTHPVGDGVIDPRNSKIITCITCHDPMGTKFKYNLRLSGEEALCQECHKNY